MSALLEVHDLKKYFNGNIKSLDGVSLTINKGETLGLVGESGCGKTTLGRTIIKLYEPDSGKIIYNGQGQMQFDKCTRQGFFV